MGLSHDKKLAAAVAAAATAYVLVTIYLDNGPKTRKIGLGDGAHIRMMLTENERLFKRVYRMWPSTFNHLCRILRERVLLHDTMTVKVEEQVAIFLAAVGQGQRYCVTMERYDRSAWTVSTYFNRVLNAIISLQSEYIRSPTSTTAHEKISSNNKFFPYFKDCIGAIDGTYIKAHIVGDDTARFYNRKSFLSQNVLAVCNFDMEFTYVMAGWEGSAADARLLRDALERPNGLKVPAGKYFLADAGYANMLGFLSPFRRTRYHLSEYDKNHIPRNSQELFNHRHSSLRSTIERTFGVWKNRFAILDIAPPFSFDTQAKLVIGCCILHNSIKVSDRDDEWGEDELIPNEDDDIEEIDDFELFYLNTRWRAEQIEVANRFRDDVAKNMWHDVLNKRVDII